jgi:hypothetical protein
MELGAATAVATAKAITTLKQLPAFTALVIPVHWSLATAKYFPARNSVALAVGAEKIGSVCHRFSSAKASCCRSFRDLVNPSLIFLSSKLKWLQQLPPK